MNKHNNGFRCTHCQSYISTDSHRSGVNNRNHCPHCLWSRHVDANQAGDRSSACKSGMEPVGLTVKKIKKKYGNPTGELMLIHRCLGCGKISINRIAADDDSNVLYKVFEASFRLDNFTRDRLQAEGIDILGFGDENIVRTQLFGFNSTLEG